MLQYLYLLWWYSFLFAKYIALHSGDSLEEEHVWRQMSEWKPLDYPPGPLVINKKKTNIGGWKGTAIHKRDTEEDAKRVCGDKSQKQCLCRRQNHVIYAAELICCFLPLPSAPGCTTPRLNNAEDLLMLCTRLCRQPHTALCMCERQTVTNICF